MRRWTMALDALRRQAGRLHGRGWPVLYWDAGSVRIVADERDPTPRRRRMRPPPPQWQLDHLDGLLRRRR